MRRVGLAHIAALACSDLDNGAAFKAYMRRGLALSKRGQLAPAVEDLAKAVALKPDDKEAKSLLEELSGRKDRVDGLMGKKKRMVIEEVPELPESGITELPVSGITEIVDDLPAKTIVKSNGIVIHELDEDEGDDELVFE